MIWHAELSWSLQISVNIIHSHTQCTVQATCLTLPTVKHCNPSCMLPKNPDNCSLRNSTMCLPETKTEHRLLISACQLTAELYARHHIYIMENSGKFPQLHSAWYKLKTLLHRETKHTHETNHLYSWTSNFLLTISSRATDNNRAIARQLLLILQDDHVSAGKHIYKHIRLCTVLYVPVLYIRYASFHQCFAAAKN